VEGYGLEKGCQADFVTLDVCHVEEAVVARPVRRSVYKAGRLVACGGDFGAPAPNAPGQ
jgi:cytosine deaminase